MKFEESLAPKKEDIKDLRDILVKYNQQHFETKEQKEFLLSIKNDDNQLIAGISGEIFGNWMEVDYLAVEENYRSHGYGKQLLQQVEALALKEKCRYIFISTFGFQGKDYYPKFGYQEVLVLENYPLTGTEHFFIKEL
ncbi:MAG: GNAT family N-acetyltransferase [Vagococcus fluvialis]|uniref:GNAT family N-acetyltransferase n=1 Tax=Vagococcus fluvialis TaxID=2738 RepID=UPI000A33ACF6|nr:GNAT family N-acetyltransferase [Vagococcus fluvialis]MBO0418927.1 GNAT family N-acetyltransferase [Vagococcus fluvialis]MBO0436991.1 GNAT family N-acetyltransferase [Vagococcus fluvialis]OTP29345.1 hypothetical protein A5798_002513 [Enterococcus sp. 6C8_DIV0013]